MKERKNQIVKILIGVPASGKTTWKKEFLRKNKDWAAVSRDDFRFMARNEPVCEPKMEAAITDMVFHAIDTYLGKKLNVIVDNTHVKARYIMDVVNYVQTRADVEYMVFDISLEKAIERDKQREKMVGEGVIRKMYADYKILVDSFPFQNQTKKVYVYKEPVYDPKLRKAIMIDLDGTLFHANGKRGWYDWDKVDRDDLDSVVYETYQAYKAAGYYIIICTGRSEEAREGTELSLRTYGIEHDMLIMRKKDDFNPDVRVKRELYEEHVEGKFAVRVVLEDKPSVCDVWRAKNLKVYQVSKGEY